MITNSGIRVAPDTETVPTPRDIAVAMGRITRFGGAIWCPLLAHSVLVGELVLRNLRSRTGGVAVATRKETWAWAVLHDAHEVVTGEVVRPWKPGDLAALQRGLNERLAKAFSLDLSLVHLELVKRMDERALCLEAEVLGLPGFRESYIKHELGGSADAYPALDAAEGILTDRLHRSVFALPSMAATDGAPGPVFLAAVLEQVKLGKLDEAISDWDQVLAQVRPAGWRVP